ncbi:MAG: zinc-binding alcohol dehydrogenase [Nitrolancea sp.]
MRARSMLLTAPEEMAWVEEEVPSPGPDDLLVETLAGAISIGTELPHYLGTSRGLEPHYSAMTGYESVARVLACGPHVTGFAPGDRIVATYGHRTHALVDARKAISVPEGISDEIAILSILSCDVAKGVRKLMPSPHDRVLVTGGGAIGLLTVWTLRQYGVEVVDLTEPREDRRELGRLLGASGVFASTDPDRIASEYAFGFECSSRDAAFALLQRSVFPDGSICILADGNLEPLTLIPDFHRKELTIVGSSDGWDYHQHARWFFERARGQEELLASLFQWRVSAGQLVETFQRLAHGNERPIKVFVRYHE